MASGGGVLDASVVLASILDEVSVEDAAPWFSGACISTVNLAEVYTKLHEIKVPESKISTAIARIDFAIIAFDAVQAEIAGALRPLTRHRGLSLADRACLALAQHLGRPAITADRAWADLDCGVPVQVIR